MVGRCLILILCCLLYRFRRGVFDVAVGGMNFFKTPSPLHLLWAVWVMDMFLQIVPIRNKVPLGSQKLFANHFRPIREKINYEGLRNYVVSTTKAAYKVFVLWCLLIAGIGALYFWGILDKITLFMISVLFYVCDLICVLIWCPFRLIMKNRCCTTCRIFNWDHLMMFSPLIFVGGFLRRFPGPDGRHRLAGVGTLRHDVSRALLGPLQCGPQMFRVHRQTLHPVLPQTPHLTLSEQKPPCTAIACTGRFLCLCPFTPASRQSKPPRPAPPKSHRWHG